MFQIKTINKISPAGLENFDKKKYSVSDDCLSPDAAVVRSASMHDDAIPPSLLAVARAGAGVNNIPIDKMSQAGVVVFNTPGANANAVKELALLGLLMSSRKVLPAIEWAKTIKDQGSEVPKLVEKGKAPFGGPEIAGKTLGVIGLGAIGILVANAAAGLSMNVIGYDPYISVKSAWSVSDRVKYCTSLREIFECCDYISLHVPLNAETKGMINSASIETMKNGVRILNFSRSELVNDADMLAALEDGRVAAYVTDFPTAEIIGGKNVIAIPHLGASTPESEDNCARMAALQLVDFLEHGNIANAVNLPAVSMERSGDLRVCVVHKNAPNLLAKISGKLSGLGLNIDNMINKSKGEYAYSMIDVSGAVNEKEVSALEQDSDVIRVRIIK